MSSYKIPYENLLDVVAYLPHNHIPTQTCGHFPVKHQIAYSKEMNSICPSFSLGYWVWHFLLSSVYTVADIAEICYTEAGFQVATYQMSYCGEVLQDTTYVHENVYKVQLDVCNSLGFEQYVM